MQRLPAAATYTYYVYIRTYYIDAVVFRRMVLNLPRAPPPPPPPPLSSFSPASLAQAKMWRARARSHGFPLAMGEEEERRE